MSKPTTLHKTPRRPAPTPKLTDLSIYGEAFDVLQLRAVPWRKSHRADPDVVPMADRHYNRQKIGAPQFVPPGRCVVLKAGTPAQLRTPWTGGAFWVTSWPFAEYVKHRWPGAWVCSAFRNEGAGLSSAMIRAAIAITRGIWPDVPAMGMVTFINRGEVRGKRDPGYCYLMAGFEPDGETEGGLTAVRLTPERMPPAIRLPGHQPSLFGTTTASPESEASRAT